MPPLAAPAFSAWDSPRLVLKPGYGPALDLTFFIDDELLLTEADLTDQIDTTEQTEIGQLNDEDIDNFITENRNRIEANCNWNNKPLIRWFNIYYERTFCSLLAFFLPPSGCGKILPNSQNIRTYYMLSPRIRCLLCHYDVFLPYLVKRTRKIWDGNTLWCPGLTALEQSKYGRNGSFSMKEIVFIAIQNLRI